jgi:hypothetical protein
MTKSTAFEDVNQGTTLATGTLPLTPLVIEGLAEFQGSFDRLCLRAGTAAIEAMLGADAEQLCGKRYERHGERQAYRWGLTASEISYHGGKASIRRSRVRKRGGAELELPSWKAMLGVQPDAHRCGDAQVCALGQAAGRRSGRPGQTRHDEVLGITAFRGAEHGEAEGMAGG